MRIWGWISLFIFSVFMGAIGANAAIPHEVQLYTSERMINESAAFQDAFLNSVNPNSSTTDDPGKDLEFCKTAKWAKTCLDLLLTYRCNQYSLPLPAVGCTAAASQFVNSLSIQKIDVKVPGDGGTVETYNLPVIFTKELEVLIQEPKVQAYLEGLLPAIRSAEKANVNFNLYEYTLSKTGNKPFIALGLIAVLFQDTSFVQIQAAYLEKLHAEKRIKSDTWKFIQSIRYISEYLDYPNMNEVNKTGWFQMYPRIGTLNKDLNYSLYHFYPMAYTAALLSASNGKRLGFFIPFLFNTDYEFQDLDPEMWPFNHPRPFKITPNLEWKMIDIYSGLVGGMFGAGLLKDADDQPNALKFKQALAKNPFGEMQSWFWSFFL